MSEDLRKKAVEMLLKGATLLGDPCPYCKGVRILDKGHALCISCGREPDQSHTPESKPESNNTALESLEAKLQSLTKELEQESDHKKQQVILESINSLIETIRNLKQ